MLWFGRNRRPRTFIVKMHNIYQEKFKDLHSTVPVNLGTNTNIKRIISTILGGEQPASGKIPVENIIKTIEYLSAISLRRSAIISQHYK